MKFTRKTIALSMLSVLSVVSVAGTALAVSPRAYLLDEQRLDIDPAIAVTNASFGILDVDYQLGFGAAVALDGDRMIVGMPVAGVPGGVGAGAQDGRLFLYERNGTGGWDAITTSLDFLDALETGPSFSVVERQFGLALDASDGHLLASVRESDVAFVGGGVLLAEWDGTSDYLPVARVFRPLSEVQSDPDGQFGAAVQVSAQHVVVGAPGVSGDGAVYAAEPSALSGSGVQDIDTNDSRIDQLTSPSPATDGRFGASLGLSGSLLVVGAPVEDSGLTSDAGRAHVFRWTGTAWTPLQSLDAAVPVVNGLYGHAVSVHVDSVSGEAVVAIGSPGDETTSRSGAVEIWRRPNAASPFVRQATLDDQDAIDSTETRLPFSSFGYSVEVLDLDTVVIGRTNSFDVRTDNSHDPDPGGEAFVQPGPGGGLTPYPFALEPSAFVFQFDLTPSSGWEVSRALTPSRVNSARSWAGWTIDGQSDGAGGFDVVLGDPLGGSFEPGVGNVFVFDPLATPIDDFDSTGTPGGDTVADAWQIKQDIASGYASRLDLNGEARVDVPNTTDECLRQIVLLVDTSESTTGGDPFLDQVFLLQDKLEMLFDPTEVEVTVLGIGLPFEGDLVVGESDGSAHDYSNIVPRRNNNPAGTDPDPNWVPELPPVTSTFNPGEIRRTGFRFLFERSDYSLDPVSEQENWGPATAIVAEHFPWRSSYRVIVPISDEPGFLGSQSGGATVLPEAFCTMLNANGVLERNGVNVFPLVTPGASGIDADTVTCAEILTGEAIGFTFPMICPSDPLFARGQHIQVPNKSTLSEQGDFSTVLGDPRLADLLLELDFLQPPTGCDPVAPECADATGDGLVDLADLNLVLSNFGLTVPAGTSGDVNGDTLVNLQDLNLVLSQFGTECGGEEKSFSMSMTDPQEIPVTTWLLLRDYPSAEAWLQEMNLLAPEHRADDAQDLKEWVEDWEAGSPE